MRQPTDPEKIQLVAVLRVLGKSQDEVASILHLGKVAVVDIEKWIRTEDSQKVWDILDDEVLKVTVVRDLPSLEEVDPKILVKALQVDRVAILVHYGRKVPEENLEENLKRHKEDLAETAKKILNKLNSYITWDDNALIGEINLEKDDLETMGFFQDQLVIGLFAHLKHDLSELAPFSRWEDLRVKDITFELRNKISMKAARREFKDMCKVCEIWMRK